MRSPMTTAIEKLNALGEALDGFLVARKDEITAVKMALLLRQHVLFYGKAGTAKSLLASLIFQAISGARIFETQLRKESGGEVVFGPMDVKKFRDEGRIEYMTDGMLPTAHFAYLDEFFDANDSVLRSMLECLHERKFSSGASRMDIPLHSVVATTNFYVADDKKEAVVDRFLFRLRTLPLGDSEGMLEMLNGWIAGNRPDVPSLSFREIQMMSAGYKNVKFSGEMAEVFISLVGSLREKMKGLYISDRRICWTADILRVSALLAGRKEVELDDLEASRFGLTTVHDEKQDEAFFLCLQNCLGDYRKEIDGNKFIREIESIVAEAKTKIMKKNKSEMLALSNLLAAAAHRIDDPKRSKWLPKAEQEINKAYTEIKTLQEDVNDIIGVGPSPSAPLSGLSFAEMQAVVNGGGK